MGHPFFEARQKIGNMRRAANLLEGVDKYAQPDFLLTMAAVELTELGEEIAKHGTPEYSQKKLEGEFDDVYVFYMSWLLTHAPQVDMMATVHSANGYGSHSAALERLDPVIRDAADDPASAVPEFVNRFFSVGLHLPAPYVTFGTLDRTIGKVLSNRHPHLYNTYCPILKRELKGEELVLKYLHLEKGTRMLRATVQRTLVESDWRPHQQRLENWVDSDAQLAALSLEVNTEAHTTKTPLVENAKMEISR